MHTGDLDSAHAAAHDGRDHDDGKVHSHISPFNFYLGIFGALIVLTCLTVGVSYVHLGALNLAVAIAIASVKAALVVTFFMHLRHDNTLNSVIFICGLLFIGVFFAYTMNDTEKRQNELNDVSGNHIYLGAANEDQAPAPGGFVPPKAEVRVEGKGIDGDPMKAPEKHH
jgi:cytochrome c oxidase subunit IV